VQDAQADLWTLSLKVIEDSFAVLLRKLINGGAVADVARDKGTSYQRRLI
jgi:hypothetical protein